MKDLPTYQEQRRDPRWQKRRLEILERDRFRCRNCETSDRELHVHHRYYIPKRSLWAYPDGSLITLCSYCHNLAHNYDRFFYWEEILDSLSSAIHDGPPERNVHLASAIGFCSGVLIEADHGFGIEDAIRGLSNAIYCGLVDSMDIKFWRYTIPEWGESVSSYSI